MYGQHAIDIVADSSTIAWQLERSFGLSNCDVTGQQSRKEEVNEGHRDLGNSSRFPSVESSKGRYDYECGENDSPRRIILHR